MAFCDSRPTALAGWVRLGQPSKPQFALRRTHSGLGTSFQGKLPPVVGPFKAAKAPSAAPHTCASFVACVLAAAWQEKRRRPSVTARTRGGEQSERQSSAAKREAGRGILKRLFGLFGKAGRTPKSDGKMDDVAAFEHFLLGLCRERHDAEEADHPNSVQIEKLAAGHFVTPTGLEASGGLLLDIWPLLVDSLYRGEGWDRVLGSVRPPAIAPPPKVLLTCLLKCVPPAFKLRVAELASRHYPLPWVFHCGASHQFAMDTSLFVHIDTSIPFLASIPIGSHGGSSLLVNRLFKTKFENNRGSHPFHPGSIDISLGQAVGGGRKFHVLDAHSLDGGPNPNLATVLFAQYVLIQTTYKKRNIDSELRNCLQKLTGVSNFSDTGKRIFLVFRDVQLDDVAKVEEYVAQVQEDACMNGYGERLQFACVPHLESLSDTALDFELNELLGKILEHFHSADEYDSFAHVQVELHEHCAQDAVKFAEEPAEWLKNRALIAGLVSGVSDWADLLPWSLRPLASNSQNTEEVEQRKNYKPLSPFTESYIKGLLTDPGFFPEWKHQLGKVAASRQDEVAHLKDQLLEANVELERADLTIERYGGADDHSSTWAQKLHEAERIQQEAQQKIRHLDSEIKAKTVTCERVWREAAEIHDTIPLLPPAARESLRITEEEVQQAFAHTMGAGFAQEILDGDHGVFHEQLLLQAFERVAKSVAGDFGGTVAILGPQSTGKSTLANATFGTTFATSAGRCTKGLYAALMESKKPGVDHFLFLDSEGLCSVERDREFDQKLAILTLAMSDVIIVNIRGEIDSTTQSLLQMAVYCLTEMSIRSYRSKPEVLFVMRDMVDLSKDMQREAMRKVEAALREATKPLSHPDGSPVDLADVLHFSAESFVLFPSAFCMDRRTLETHDESWVWNPAFGEECFKLRMLIMRKLAERQPAVQDLKEWARRFAEVKLTIDRFGHLGRFQDIKALLTRQRFDMKLLRLVEQFVQENQTGTALGQKLRHLEEEMRKELLDDSVGTTWMDRQEKNEAVWEKYAQSAELMAEECGRQMLRDYKAFYQSSQDLTPDLVEEGRRMLENRPSLFLETQLRMFRRTVSQWNADNCVHRAAEELAKKLREYKCEHQDGQVPEEDAKMEFKNICDAQKEKLKQHLTKSQLEYPDLINQHFRSFTLTKKTKALSAEIILGEKDAQQLPRKEDYQRNIRLDLPHASLLEDGLREAGVELDGWTITTVSGSGAPPLVPADEILEVNGTLVGDLGDSAADAGGEQWNLCVQRNSEVSNTFDQLVEHSEASGPSSGAKEQNLVDNVCSFFANTFKLASTVGKDDFQIIQGKSATALQIAARAREVIDRRVREVEPSLSNLHRLINTLWNDLDKLGDIADDATRRLWKVKAEVKNTCLNEFRTRLIQHLQQRQENTIAEQVDRFEDYITEKESSFVTQVSCVMDENTKATVFVQELVQEILRQTKDVLAQEFEGKLQNLFPDPEEFLKQCNDHFILDHTKRSDDELFDFITKPEESMRSYAKSLWEQETEGQMDSIMQELRQDNNSVVRELKYACNDFLYQAETIGLEHTRVHQGFDVDRFFQSFFTKGKADKKLEDGAVATIRTEHVVRLPTTCTFDEVTDLHTFISRVSYELSQVSSLEDSADRVAADVRELVGRMQEECIEHWIGCTERCPYCRNPCAHPRHDPQSVKHSCSMHRPVGFGGVRHKKDNRPRFFLCDSIANYSRRYLLDAQDAPSRYVTFQEHVRHANPDWHIPMAPDSPYYRNLEECYNQIWDRIGTRLCKYHRMTYCSVEEGRRLEEEEEPELLQMCIVLDTTGSMNWALDQCKEDLAKLVQELKGELESQSGWVDVPVEIGFVGYKDKKPDGGVDVGHLEHHDLTRDIEAVKEVIKAQEADGGGDIAEDIAGALDKLLEFSWSDNATKVAVLVTDAPCHGPEFSDLCDDCFPEDGKLMPPRLKTMMNQEISLLVSSINEVTRTMEARMKNYYAEAASPATRFDTFSLSKEGAAGLASRVANAVATMVVSNAL